MRSLLVLIALAAAGCGGSSTTTTPTPPSLAGTWIGTATAPASPAGPGAVRATIAQNGVSLTGTWGSTYSNAAFNDGGSLSGTTSGSSVSITLSPGVPTACPYSLTGLLNGSTAMSGTFTTFNCTVALTGSFTLTKQ